MHNNKQDTKQEDHQTTLKQVGFYIKHARQMLECFGEFYKVLDELVGSFEKYEKAPGRIMIFFTAKELAQSLHSNNAQEIESLLSKNESKKYFNEGETRYELLDILKCFNNIFQSILKI